MLSSSNVLGDLNRVVALVDMDCFYVQVEERDNPHIRGVPAAVVQYKTFEGGGIIAVNYEARARGVTRNMRGNDALKVCPEIILVRVPEWLGKADLTKYRNAGKEVVDILSGFDSVVVERASIDEAYLDLTDHVNKFLEKVSPNPEDDPIACLDAIDLSYLDQNFPVGFESTTAWIGHLKSGEIIQMEDVKLAIGAEIVGRMRKAVLEKTGFKCSAGIAHNKVLAKLGAGMNKPNKQTVIPHDAVPQLYSQTKVSKVRMLGGQLGYILTGTFKCETMSDILQFTLNDLTKVFGAERGQWLFSLARGYDDEPVTLRPLPKSIGCSKNFRGPEMLKTKEEVHNWIGRLCEEVVDRIQHDLELNNRRANLLTLHVTFHEKNALSRSCGKNVQYDARRMTATVMEVVNRLYQQFGVLPVINLGLIASKLEEETVRSAKISDYYRVCAPAKQSEVKARSPIPITEDVKEESGSGCNLKQIDALNNEISGAVRLLPTRTTHVLPQDSPSFEDEIDVEGYTPVSLRPQAEEIKEYDRGGCASNGILQTPKKSTGVELPAFACTKSPPKLRPFEVGEQPVCRTGLTFDSSVTKDEENTEDKTKSKISRDEKPSASVPVKSVPAKNELLESANINEGAKDACAGVSDRTSIAISNAESVCGARSDNVWTDQVDTKNLADEFLQACDRCGCKVPVWEMLNHMDFHMAIDLQKEMSLSSYKTNMNSKSEGTAAQKRAAVPSRGQSSSKRGRPSKSAPTGTSASKMRTLESYFTPK